MGRDEMQGMTSRRGVAVPAGGLISDREMQGTTGRHGMPMAAGGSGRLRRETRKIFASRSAGASSRGWETEKRRRARRGVVTGGKLPGRRRVRERIAGGSSFLFSCDKKG